MSEVRVRRSINSLVWYIYTVVVTSVMPFIIRSLLIRFIGIEYTGVSSLFSSILQVINLADMGFDTAIVYYLYKPFAKNDTDRINAVLKVMRNAYLIIGSIVLIIGLCLTPFISFFVKDEYPEGLNIYYIYLIYIANAVIPYFLGQYRIVLFRADQRADIIYKVGGTAALVMYVIQIFVITILGDFYLYSLLLLLGTGIQVIWQYLWSRVHYPNIKCEGSLDQNFYSGLWKRIFAIGMAKIRDTSRNSFDSIVISKFMGIVILAEYQNYYQVIHIPVMLVSAIATAIMPSWGNGVAEESEESNYGVLKSYTFIHNAVSTVCLACLINLYQPFIKLWVGEDYLLPYSMVVLFSVCFYITSLTYVPMTLRSVTGIWWEGTGFYILEAMSNLVLNLLLVRMFGLYGVIGATAFTILFINIPIELHYVFKLYFHKSPWKHMGVMLRYSIVSAGITIVVTLVCNHIVVDSFFVLVVKAIVTVSFTSIIYALIYWRYGEMRNLRNMVREMLHK